MSNEHDDERAEKAWKDRRELRTTATPQQAWEAWAKPEIIAGWFADRATGTPRAGETITHVFEDFGMEVPFTVVEAIPGERIIFDGVGPGGRPFRQEIHIRRDGGETVLELVHSGFEQGEGWEGEFEGMDSGWTLALAVLRHYLEHYFGRPKVGVMSMRPAAFDLARADELFRRREGLAAWLTTGEGEIGDVGSAVALPLRNGHRVSGKVLAWSGREVAMTWPEIEGTLELKAFAMPGGTMVGVRVFSWAAEPPTDALKAFADTAADALAKHLAG